MLIDALQRAARYSSLVNEGMSQKCVDGRDYRYVAPLCRRQPPSGSASDRVLDDGDRAHVPATDRPSPLADPRAADPSFGNGIDAEFAEFFGDDIEFGAAIDEIAFAKKVRNLPVVSADPYLNKLLVKYCEEALSCRPLTEVHSDRASRMRSFRCCRTARPEPAKLHAGWG